MSVLAVIPARYGSTRFPGKPLAEIAGQMMIERVWRLSAAAEGVGEEADVGVADRTLRREAQPARLVAHVERRRDARGRKRNHACR